MTRGARWLAAAAFAAALTGCRRPMTFGAWISEWHPDVSLLKAHPELYDSISFSWCHIQPDGGLKRVAPPNRDALVRWAHERGIKVYVTIGGGPPGITGKASERCIKELVAVCEKYGFDGVDVDIEGLDKSFRDTYTLFIAHLVAALKTMTPPRRLSVTLAEIQDPKVEANYFADYRVMGRLADEVRIMCYDVNWDKPGPIIDRESFAADLAFALSRIPAAKLVPAVPWYGRDWNVTDGTHEDILWRMTSDVDGISGMNELVAKWGGKPVWREPEGELSYTYTAAGKRHEVWMADAKQFARMVDEVRKAGAVGIYVWQLEYADPAFIPVVRAKVKR